MSELQLEDGRIQTYPELESITKVIILSVYFQDHFKISSIRSGKGDLVSLVVVTKIRAVTRRVKSDRCHVMGNV